MPSGALVAGGEQRKPGFSVAGSSPLGPHLPGECLVVRFKDDMEDGRERLILLFDSGDGDCFVLTADGEVYSERESDWNEAILMIISAPGFGAQFFGPEVVSAFGSVVFGSHEISVAA